MAHVAPRFSPSDSIILDPSDSLAEGQEVRVHSGGGAPASGAAQ